MNLIINTVGGQFLTLTPEMLQEKLGLKSDILSLGIEVSDDNTAITAQSYTKWECAGDTICPLIDVNVKNDGKHPVFVDDGFGKPVLASDVIQNRDGELSSRCSTSKELFDFNVKVAQNR